MARLPHAGRLARSSWEFMLSRGPGSTVFRRALKIEQRDHGHSQGLGDLEQVQVRGIAPSRFEAAHVGPVQLTFPRQLLLRPASGETKAPKPLTEFSESGMWGDARRHAPMVTMGHIAVYRPGSTCSMSWACIERGEDR